MHPHDDPFARLPRDAPPPPGLRKRVMADLEARGDLRSRRRLAIHPVLAVAAAAILMVGGAAVGRATGPADEAVGQGRYVLLLLEGPTYQPAAQEAARVAEYAEWARELGARVTMGEKLSDEQRILGAGAASAPPPPEVVAGFFIIDADGWDEAMAIARDCPHLRYGGRVAVREIVT